MAKTDAALLQRLSQRDYVEERNTPQISSQDYLPLVDLLSAIRRLAPKEPLDVLDFGCGGSPYRHLFRGTYIRADLADNPSRDIEISEGGLLPIEPEQFDLVLSTQVLEHVRAHEKYLQEAQRVLKPKGALLLTTHGMFEEHGSPNDYWRWTTDGLTAVIEGCGFTVERCHKITVGPRATLYWLLQDLRLMGSGRNVLAIYPVLFWIIRKLGVRRLNEFADKHLSEFSQENTDMPHWSRRYIGIAILARKAAQPSDHQINQTQHP